MDNKPYRSLNEYYREVFGRKTAKISLDGGFTCPNRDGRCGTSGCLFCSAGGSGDFAESAALSIKEQVEQGKSQTSDKWKDPAYVAYFQAFTNTYAPAEELRQKYEEALSCEGIEGISIATRADCLPDDVLDLLAELNQKTKLWVELGLQTADEVSAEYIRRGYPYAVFEKAVLDLAERNIPVIVHVILGLPNENRETILKTIDCVNRLPVQGIKLQLLHVLSDSDLADIYEAGNYTPLTKEEYISLVGDCIAHLREDIVIHRITGDGDKNTLLAPLWSLRKRDVLNSIHKYLKENHIRQGMSCKFD
ncbi:MAG: TIGR01212 family radical SAM protein [Anaerotignum sp.]|nr:TIGR01212 family radical SAM protein [Anaerotignum sp.]